MSATAAWLGISWPTELTSLWSTAVCMLITTWGCFCHHSNRWVVYASTLITSQESLCHCGKRWVVCASSLYTDYHSGLSNGWVVYASNWLPLGMLYFTSATGEWSMPLHWSPCGALYVTSASADHNSELFMLLQQQMSWLVDFSCAASHVWNVAEFPGESWAWRHPAWTAYIFKHRMLWCWR